MTDAVINMIDSRELNACPNPSKCSMTGSDISSIDIPCMTMPEIVIAKAMTTISNVLDRKVFSQAYAVVSTPLPATTVDEAKGKNTISMYSLE